MLFNDSPLLINETKQQQQIAFQSKNMDEKEYIAIGQTDKDKEFN